MRTCLLALVLLALPACDRFSAGLSNASSIERKTETRRENDSISNGAEGCASRDGGPSMASSAGGCAKGGSQ
jgi:hypothetical protein